MYVNRTTLTAPACLKLPIANTNAKPGMINSQNDPVAWAMLAYELDDAQDGLRSLLEDIAKEEKFDEVDFRIHMAHIFSHLNRAWNARNATEQQHQDDALWEEWRKFPTDLEL